MSAAEQAGLSPTWSQTLKIGFLAMWLIFGDVDGSEWQIRNDDGGNANYRKTPKNSDTWKIVVIILKFEQWGSTTDSWVQTMQTEWQTV